MSLDPTPSMPELLAMKARREERAGKGVAAPPSPPPVAFAPALGPDSPLLPTGRKSPGAKGARSRDLEHLEQAAFVAWTRTFPDDHPLRAGYAIPNGGGRSAGEGAKLKAEGVEPGVPDWHLPVPRDGHASLYLEFKAEARGELKATQLRRHATLRRFGNRVETVFTASAAKAVARDYLGLTRAEAPDEPCAP